MEVLSTVLPQSMAAPLVSAYGAYSEVLAGGDPRVEGWPLMASPLPTAIICLAFVYIVKVAGPAFMKDRAPYELKHTLIVYNFLQVLVSTYIFWEFGMGGWLNGYSYRCQPVDYSMQPIAQRMVMAAYLYYLSKFSEFFDTFFFVLRKKSDHISLLHVVHHGIMPFSVWMGVKFTPGGHSTFFGFLNTFVHIFMYLYYMVAAMGPKYRKFITWKRHLTKLQIVQFFMIIAHSFQLCFRECDYPVGFVYWIGGHGFLFLGLFANFYYSAYTSKQTGTSRVEAGGEQKPDQRDVLGVLGRIVPCNLPSVCEVSQPINEDHVLKTQESLDATKAVKSTRDSEESNSDSGKSTGPSSGTASGNSSDSGVSAGDVEHSLPARVPRRRTRRD